MCDYAADCGPVTSLDHGGITALPTSTRYESSVQYVCELGYRLEGQANVTCTAAGQWSTLPTCILIGDRLITIHEYYINLLGARLL